MSLKEQVEEYLNTLSDKELNALFFEQSINLQENDHYSWLPVKLVDSYRNDDEDGPGPDVYDVWCWSWDDSEAVHIMFYGKEYSFMGADYEGWRFVTPTYKQDVTWQSST